MPDVEARGGEIRHFGRPGGVLPRIS